MWGTVRVTSVPQQTSTPLGTFATSFAQQVSEVKVNEVAQDIEFLAGANVRLTNRLCSLEVFKAFPVAPGVPQLPTGTEFVAFVSPDRDRSFRQCFMPDPGGKLTTLIAEIQAFR